MKPRQFSAISLTVSLAMLLSIVPGEAVPAAAQLQWEPLAANLNPTSPTARQDSTWHIETVDSTGDVGQHTSLTLDSSDYPHISYYDVTSSTLTYAYLDASGRYTETVDNFFAVGQYTSLALDGNGYPHISYYGELFEPFTGLRYAHKDSSGWHLSFVESGDGVGQYTSLALDSSNRPHISYYDDTNQDLKYAR